MDIKDVENLAKLSRIRLSEDEKNSLLSDMKGILEYVKQIEQMETGDEEVAKIEGHTPHNVWREDLTEVREFSPELIIRQFPDSKDGFLKVKKIL